MDDLGPEMSETIRRGSSGVGRWSQRKDAKLLRSRQNGRLVDLVFMFQSVREACQAFYLLSLVAEEASMEGEALQIACGVHE